MDCPRPKLCEPAANWLSGNAFSGSIDIDGARVQLVTWGGEGVGPFAPIIALSTNGITTND